MLPLSVKNKLDNVLKSTLIVDIETCALSSSGKEIEIRGNFEEYISMAKVKWVGCYSYKNKKQYYLNAQTQAKEIISLLNSHDILVHFNGLDFDIPILANNGFVDTKKRYNHIDLMVILGLTTAKTKDGYKYKGRGALMDYKFKKNSLRHMAEIMQLETQKGDIDFKIFQKNEWTKEETNEILKYLSSDVMAEKQMFDKLVNYWKPFAELIDEKYVYDLSWLKNSIASLTYKSVCRVLNEEPTYGEIGSQAEEMGGFVLLPKQEESYGVFYVDYTSLYPNIFSCFNLTAEIPEEDIENHENVWHGNDLFKVRGYYDCSKWHILSKWIAEKLEERIRLKQNDSESPLIYTLKIILNTIYGIIRSAIFEKVHTKNAGYDCCWIGQQINEFTRRMLEQFGFNILQSDTDGFMIKAIDDKNNNKKYVLECLDQIVEIIKEHMPYPTDNFTIKIEEYFDYLLSPFSEQPIVEDKIREQLNKELVKGYIEKEVNKKKCVIDESSNIIVKIGRSWVKTRMGRKKNYLFIANNKVELVGLPLKKDTATPLGVQIFKEVLEPEILKNKRAKFPKKYIQGLIEEYLKKDGVLESLATEYKVQRIDTYKEYKQCLDKSKYEPKQIQCQISMTYFGGEAGVIRLIKNSKVGKVGKGMSYCSLEEAKKVNLTANDLDLTKVYNELEVFCVFEPKP